MSYSEPTKEEKRERLLNDARVEKSKLKAMLELIKGDPDCEAVLIIDGVKHTFSSSDIFVKVIKNEILEIQKACDMQPNKWE